MMSMLSFPAGRSALAEDARQIEKTLPVGPRLNLTWRALSEAPPPGPSLQHRTPSGVIVDCGRATQSSPGYVPSDRGSPSCN